MTRPHVQPPWRRSALLLRLGAIAAFVLWFYSPYLEPCLPDGDIMSDVMVKEVQRDAVGSPLAKGGWHPFFAWDATLMCGRPGYGFPSPFVLFELPFRGLDPIARMKALVVLFHVLAGLAMYALLAGIGAGSDAALFGGAVYPVMAAHISRSAVQGHIHLPMFWAILPLIALACFRLRARDARSVVLLGLALAAGLLRDTQRTVLTVVVIGLLAAGWLAWGLARGIIVGDRRPPRAAIAFLLLLGAAFTLAVAVEAFDVVNGFVGDPYRGGWVGHEQDYWLARWSVDNLYSYFDWDVRLATWLHPHVSAIGPSISRYLGVSLVLIVLAALAARAVPPGQRARLAAALLLLVLSAWLSFGIQPVWRPMLVRWKGVLAAPGISTAAKAGLVAIPIGFSLLVAWLVARTLRPHKLRYPLAIAATAAAMSLFLGWAPLNLLRRSVFFLREFRNPDWIQVAVSSFAIAFAAAIAASGLAARAGGKRGRALFGALLLLAVLDVLPYRVYLTRSQETAASLASLATLNRTIADDPGWCRVLGTYQASNLTDLGYLWHRKPLAWDFRSYTAPRRTLKFFVTYFDFIARNRHLELVPPLASLAGVKYIVELSDRTKTILSDVHVPGLERRFANEHGSVFENTEWRPQVRAYPAAAVLMGDLHSSGVRLAATLERLNVALLAVDGPQHAALLDGSRPVCIEIEDVPRTAGVPADVFFIDDGSSPFTSKRSFVVEPAITSTRPGPERILVHVSSQEPLVLTVSESYHPWWHASVDGREATVYPGGFAFLGLPLDRGEHAVEFRFVRPWQVNLWAYVSLGALALSLGYVWRTRGRRAVGEPLIPGD